MIDSESEPVGSPGPSGDGTDAYVDPAAAPQSEAAAWPDARARRFGSRLRFGVLMAVLALVTGAGILHQYPIAGTRSIGVDALCPFGGLESLWALVSGGSLLQRIAVSSLVIFGFTVVLALVFRRVFCGYLCPLGALQELFGRFGRKLFGRARPKMPSALDRPARFLKYAVLAVVVVWTWQAGALIVRGVDPWVAFMHLSTAEVLTEFGAGAIVLVIGLAGSLLYERFFCKYLCPMGALLALISRVAPFAITRDQNTCTNCAACDRACPVGVQVSSASEVTDPECIECGECTRACPSAGTLAVRLRSGRTRRYLTPGRQMGVAVAALVGTLALATAAGAFEWTIATQPTVAGGTVDAESIKGYMSFADIAAATGIPPARIEERFGVAPSDMTAPIKDLASEYGFDVHTDVRAFVEQEVAAASAPAASGTGED